MSKEKMNNAVNSVKNYDYKGFGANYWTNVKASFKGAVSMISDLFSYGKGYILIGILVSLGLVLTIMTTIISTYFVTLYTRRKTIEIQQNENK